MRPGPASQTGRLLALLELGGWWTTRDLLNEVPSIVHSRISSLRDAGYVIEHRKTGTGAAGSLYRLVGFHGTTLQGQDGATASASPVLGAATESAPQSPPSTVASLPAEGAVPQRPSQALPTKRCCGCGEHKLLSDFRGNASNRDGKATECRRCAQARKLRARKENPEAQARHEEAAARSKARHREKYNAQVREHRRDPLVKVKLAAQDRVHTAIKNGLLIRPDICSECGRRAKIDAHHDDYGKPLEVRWLCRRCHAAFHKAQQEEGTPAAERPLSQQLSLTPEEDKPHMYRRDAA